MMPLRRHPKPLPPSVRVHDDVPWVDPDELKTPWWRRTISGVSLLVLTAILGIVLAVAIGIVLLGSFFLMDFLIS